MDQQVATRYPSIFVKKAIVSGCNCAVQSSMVLVLVLMQVFHRLTRSREGKGEETAEGKTDMHAEGAGRDKHPSPSVLLLRACCCEDCDLQLHFVVVAVEHCRRAFGVGCRACC